MNIENQKLLLVPFLTKKGKYGYVNADSLESISSKEYDDASCFSNFNNPDINDLALVELNGKRGMIDRNGEEIIDVIYDEIIYTEQSIISVKLNNKVGILNDKGQVLVPIIYDKIRDKKGEFVITNLDKKEGVFKIGFGELIPNKHSIISTIRVEDNLIMFEIKNKVGILNQKNKLLLFKEINKINEKYLKYKDKEKYGLLSSIGVEVIVAKYDELSRYSNSIYGYKINDLYGFLNCETAMEVCEPKYQFIHELQEGYSIASLPNWKRVFIDEYGFQRDGEYDKLGKYCEGLAWYQIGDEFGYLNLNGEKEFQIKADQLENFENGVARYYLNKKVGLINNKGTIILEAFYDKISDPFLNGYRTYEKDGNSGIIDHNFKILKEFHYSKVKFLNDSFLVYEMNYMCGLLNISGEKLSEPKFDYLGVSNLNSDLFSISAEKKVGLLNKKGQSVAEPIYDKLEVIEDKYDSDISIFIRATLNKKKGVLEMDGNVLIPIIYDEIIINKNYLILTLNRKVEVYSLHEKSLVNLEFSLLGNDKTYEKFESEIISIKKEEGMVILNEYGKIISDNKYDSIGTHTSSLSFLHSYKTSNKFGFLKINNENVEERIPAKYDLIISEFGKWNRYKMVNYDASSFARVKLGDQSFYISEFGKEYREI